MIEIAAFLLEEEGEFRKFLPQNFIQLGGCHVCRNGGLNEQGNAGLNLFLFIICLDGVHVQTSSDLHNE